MVALSGIHHLKLPVADVARSRDWYVRVLGFEKELDFVEDDVLMGVGLRDAAGTVRLAVRKAPERSVALAGFDPVAFGVSSVGELESWRHHLDDLGEAHRGIVRGHLGSVLIGLHDPDGIEVRFYTMEVTDPGVPR